MPERDIRKSSLEALSRMMALKGDGSVWRPDELGAILRHQLSAPLEFDLGSRAPRLASKVRTLAAAQGLRMKSFADLFAHPNPPAELLQLTKQYAKACGKRPESPLPREIAMLLYFLSIAVALVKCQQRISDLDDAQLRQGFEQFFKQSWVDEGSRAILSQGLECLTGKPGG